MATTPDTTQNFLMTNNEVEPTAIVRSPTGEETTIGSIGQSGTYLIRGIITQEEYNADLYREEALRVYDRMRRSDGTVSAILLACKLPIIGATWKIEPASDKPLDIEIADFISRELMNRKVQFSDFLREGLTMFDFGYAVAEKVLELTDYNGKQMIGLSGIPFRKQRSVYYWETEDHKPGITQIVLGGKFSIPREKLVIFTHDKEGENYEGRSLLRPAYKHWQIKDKLYLIDAMKHERQGLGVVAITAPKDAHQSDIDKAIDAARNIRANEEAYIKAPDGFTIEFMDMHASGTTDITASALHHDRQISKSILVQFLELGASGGSGSRSLSEDHSRLFLMSEEAAAKNLTNVIQKDIINYLVDLNYSNVTNYPKLEHSRIGDDDVQLVSTAIKDLVSVGALTPDPDMEQHLRNTLHLNDLPEAYRKDYDNRPKTGTKTTAPADPTTTPADNAQSAKPTPAPSDSSDITASDAYKAAISARTNLVRMLDSEYAAN